MSETSETIVRIIGQVRPIIEGFDDVIGKLNGLINIQSNKILAKKDMNKKVMDNIDYVNTTELFSEISSVISESSILLENITKKIAMDKTLQHVLQQFKSARESIDKAHDKILSKAMSNITMDLTKYKVPKLRFALEKVRIPVIIYTEALIRKAINDLKGVLSSGARAIETDLKWQEEKKKFGDTQRQQKRTGIMKSLFRKERDKLEGEERSDRTFLTQEGEATTREYARESLRTAPETDYTEDEDIEDEDEDFGDLMDESVF